MIKYGLKGRKNALELTRKIYGYTDSSNNGQYKYERKGILSDIQYEKIANAVFWIDPKYEEQVIKELLKLKLKVEVFHLIIKER
ncbi:MAG: hypothetical protein AAB968_04985 [Patescibacteria group bacterium]